MKTSVAVIMLLLVLGVGVSVSGQDVQSLLGQATKMQTMLSKLGNNAAAKKLLGPLNTLTKQLKKDSKMKNLSPGELSKLASGMGNFKKTFDSVKGQLTEQLAPIAMEMMSQASQIPGASVLMEKFGGMMGG